MFVVDDWLLKARVEASSGFESIIFTAILLKLGICGLLRIRYLCVLYFNWALVRFRVSIIMLIYDILFQIGNISYNADMFYLHHYMQSL